MARPLVAAWPRTGATAEHWPTRLESLCAALIAALFSDALVGPIFDPAQTGEVPWLRLIWLPAYLLVLLLAAARARRLARYWRAAVVLAILVGWAAASIAWSLDPATTARRALALAFTTLFGLWLAAALDGERLARMLAGAFLVLGLATLVVCVLDPAFGVQQGDNKGAWKGLWYEKNQMGALMSVGALSAGVSALAAPAGGRLWWATGALSAFLVVMSRSLTDLAMLAFVMVGLGAWRVASRGVASAVAVAWTLAAAAFAAAIVALTNPGLVWRALGKDPTLTGRTDIWGAIAQPLADKPWLGWGYGAFWGRRSPPALWIRDELGWLVPSAHNGWLDLRLQLGWIGVGLFIAASLAAFGAAGFRRSGDPGRAWAMLMLAAFGLASLSESVILQQNDLFWVLAAAALARLLGPAGVIPTERHAP